MGKLEGQIWIEKQAPYKLKYHTNGKDFAIDTVEEYKLAAEPEKTPVVGDLVKINTSGSLEKASFPDDLRNVIGMLVSETGSVSKTGYVNIPLSTKIKDAFIDTDAINNLKVGDNLYWLDTGIYSHRIVKGTEVKYHNLPLIGTVTNITNKTTEGVEEDGAVKDGAVTVHLNISSFDTTIEWSMMKAVDASKTSIESIEVPHNLPEADFVKSSIEIDDCPAIASSSYDRVNKKIIFSVNPHDNTEGATHTYRLSGSMIYG